MRIDYTLKSPIILGVLLATAVTMNLAFYPIVLQQSADLKLRFQLFESRIESANPRNQADPVGYRLKSAGTGTAPEAQAGGRTEASEGTQLNWRSQRVRRRVQSLKPIDWQLARITRFERAMLQKRRDLYDAARPLGVETAQSYLDRFSAQFGFDAEIALRETNRNHPWAMPIGARPAIHMRPIDRQPYLLAHEFAHVFTRETNHGAGFVQAYANALVLLGVDRAELEIELQRQGIAF